MNVLLDLDGTLTDPREGIVRCIRHALAQMGEPCPPEVELLRFIGPPLHVTFGAMLGIGSARVARAVELYRERFSATGIFENRLYPGIPETLRELGERGARLVVATSKPTVFAERVVEHFGLGLHIEAVFGSELDGTRSDKGELIARVLEKSALRALDACMVGDREHDMRGAKANGVRPIGALWGYGSRRELLDAGAAALCERPEDLVAALIDSGRC